MMRALLHALIGEVSLGWRRALRGILPWALTALLGGCLIAFPWSDGPERVHLTYGLILVWTALLITALWSGGTAYALDRERHRLTLTFTKPLRRLTLWWGRFIGTLAPFAAATVLLWLCLAPRALPEGRTPQGPELPSLDAMARAELLRLRLLRRVPPGISEARALRAVRDDLESRHTELQPASERDYTFAGLPKDATSTTDALRLGGAPFLGARDALDLEVVLTCGDRTATLTPPQPLLERGFELPLPEGLLQPGESVSLILRRKDNNGAGSVLYRERSDLHLLLPGQPALVNLTAFCTTLLLTLALAVALGTAHVCAFSLPTSLFVGTLAFLSVVSAALSPPTTVAEETANLWSKASAALSYALATPFRDLVGLSPLHGLLQGEAISFAALGKLLLRLLLPWCILCSLISVVSPVKDEDL